MKTYKRETAWACLVFLFYLGVWGRPETIDAFVWPMMMFIGSSFGMDWASKQFGPWKQDDKK